MDAEILAVGTELLMGQIANTNAQYISQRLNDIGINVYYHSVVGDNPVRLKSALELALKRSDVVIMTGGLGPTQDDLTKETVSEIMGKKLVLHDESLKRIENYFKRLNRPLTKNNIKQAYLPEDCLVIKNDNGTAPGCIIEKENKIVVMLPGPPSEMRPMLDDTVIPYFKSKSQEKIVSKYLRIFGIGESLLEEKLMHLIEKQDNVTIATYAKEGEVTIRITNKSNDEAVALRELAHVEEEIAKVVGDALYSDEDKELYQIVGEMLINKGITIAFAESCTGGLISSVITDIPGISAVFDRAVVSYSNKSKVENLGVKQETLDKFGAVSRETAVEMAEGIRKVAGTDLGLSVTGIAGPGGGTEFKPVGLVYIALASKNGTACKELRLAGNRRKIRNYTVLNAFDMIRRWLMNESNN
ncbi:competence/damage-inducible protein A [Acetivibrio clariflavus]|uniref:Putative competence-damage inducible protein n=1 Tax=Acetivibrio clariflavus (strain DSM 19732 / NBRC 101661 / EBR45) TaxID=720554 RepID=G8M1C4_ACECE|nr:competence/damage-inducible protein A [Acetivibrio clariflavus]AEV68100.1 competence/damage-inducible protein CinA-like protein [Acetivibrio clariflavus DSM 19732]HOP99454.1 competence/damage-inducible protein A [Acetivibrio clariflavus]